jgi:hypothetical protein
LSSGRAVDERQQVGGEVAHLGVVQYFVMLGVSLHSFYCGRC